MILMILTILTNSFKTWDSNRWIFGKISLYQNNLNNLKVKLLYLKKMKLSHQLLMERQL